MKNIALIFKNSVLQNKLMILISVTAAAFMCFMFYGLTRPDNKVFANADTVTVGICDHSPEQNKTTTENLKSYFEDTLGMETTEKDYDSLSKDLIDKKISAIIEVPTDFYEKAANGKPQKLELTTLGDYENAAFIEAYLNSYMSGVSVLSKAADGNEETFSEMLSSQKLPNEIKISESNAAVDEKALANGAFRSAIGFMTCIIAAVTIMISRQIMNDRNLGTYNRMKCSSIKPSEYVLGVSFFGVICCTVMNAAFIVFAYSMSDLISTPMGAAFGGMELFGLFSVGLSTMFGLLMNSPTALMTVGVGYATIGSMLGGAWFPISDSLGVVGNIAKIVPQYWLMNMVRGFEIADVNILPNMCILALAAVLAYLVSAVIFTRKSNN